MKNIMKKSVGIALAATLIFGMFSCSYGINDETAQSEQTVATPSFSVVSDEAESGKKVKITCETEGAKIYYTTDDSEPTVASTEYTAPISVTKAVTIKAIAVKDGMKDSAVAKVSYTVKGSDVLVVPPETPKETVATPAFSVAAGDVESGTKVTISCATEGAKIYYTTDDSEPTTSSTQYTAPISVTEAVTLKAIAVKNGLKDSAVASVSYKIKETVSTPAFSVAAGEVELGTKVTISCATEGAKIYYTTDGSEPTASSTQYTTPINVAEPVTLKAFAVKEGMNDSSVVSISYTILVKVPECILVAGGKVTGADYTDNYGGVFPLGRNVTLSSFYMGKYEVTQAQYKSVMAGQKVTVGGTEYTLADSPSCCVQGSTEYGIDSDKDHANYPVENVTWFDAVYYCNVLSAKENLDPCYSITVTSVNRDGKITEATVEYDKTKNGYRLPTEAEWEYAARGGNPTKQDWNYTFSGANTADETSYNVTRNAGLDSVGWYKYNNLSGKTDSEEGKGTHEVGQKDANALGIYDMSGNVNEWCYDRCVEASFEAEEITDPIGVSSGENRVYRGGSWSERASSASVSHRNFYLPDFRTDYLGFRVVRSSSN